MNDSGKAEQEVQKAEVGAAGPNAGASAGETAGLGGEAAPEGAPGVNGPAAALENLKLENTELKDKLLRTLAEMENLRRRTEREIGEARAYGMASFARDMLPFADNLRRALEALPAGVREQAESSWQAFAEGIEVTGRDFLSRLGKYGVKKLEPQGAKFDPNFHEALFEVPDETAPSGTIVQIIEDGYAIGDRVLRPAKVGVSRGGPKAANEGAAK
ncbi:MAG: nucleotide exchange factor GrpE [Beijerinckiaceae bacterium]|nr:nucleotide exchange factor GrpE [Beijerinckiaceae bacterium]